MGRAARAKRERRETGHDPRRRRSPLPVQGEPPPRWNGEPCIARRCLVIVGTDGQENSWASDIVGTARRAVEVHFGGEVFYIDDEKKEPRPDEMPELEAAAEEMGLPLREVAFAGYFGWGWHKVTKGRGAPRYGHRELVAEKIVEYMTGCSGCGVESGARHEPGCQVFADTIAPSGSMS